MLHIRMVHIGENKQILEGGKKEGEKKEKNSIVGQRKESDKNHFFTLM